MRLFINGKKEEKRKRKEKKRDHANWFPYVGISTTQRLPWNEKARAAVVAAAAAGAAGAAAVVTAGAGAAAAAIIAEQKICHVWRVAIAHNRRWLTVFFFRAVCKLIQNKNPEVLLYIPCCRNFGRIIHNYCCFGHILSSIH